MMEPKEKKVVTLAMDKCPHGCWAITVNLRGRHGTRLTHSKCCGTWTTVREWTMSKADLLRAADEISGYAEHAQ